MRNSANNSWPDTTKQTGAPVPHLQQPFFTARHQKGKSTAPAPRVLQYLRGNKRKNHQQGFRTTTMFQNPEQTSSCN
ncbi:hypothetical protein Nepgr_003937 [Nepenthes gracilis]|uniref:Uncharacterized protein n=1 Tax=Nepenthes gracilis TaxID=150966 RepID=A0AAD3XEE9_NEPGR|nr:hypothetical protein Nepgr_003937 [Nepenthes gracilis]